jgi:two-component system NarL family sensor kinase
LSAPGIEPAFPFVLGAFACFAALTAWLTRAHRAQPPPELYIALDIVFITILCSLSGGADSEVRRAFYLPMVAAIFVPVRVTLLVTVLAVGGYLLAALAGDEQAPGRIAAFAISLAWFGATATLLSGVRARRSAALRDANAMRTRLVAETLDAADRERERISEELHQDAVQELTLAIQDLDEVRHGRPERVEDVHVALTRSLDSLRHAITELHPVVLEHGGLQSALTSLGTRVSTRAGFDCKVDVDPAVPHVHDRLILALATELLQNAAKHAQATTTTVRVVGVEDGVLLEVADDGVGVPPGAPDDALDEGHIGLASCATRTSAVGGTFTIGAGPEGGAVVSALLPCPAFASGISA